MQGREAGFEFRFVHKDKDGNVKYDSGFLKNHMTDDGFQDMYETYFQGTGGPDNAFEIGLNTASLTQTSSFADLSEVTGTGYARQTLTRDATGFPTIALNVENNMQVDTATVTFENTDPSDAWSTATDGFLASNDSVDGYKLVCFRALSANRTLQAGDTLDVTIKVKGEQPA